MQDSIGKPVPRVDGRAKVTGKAIYAAEQKIPNATHAVMVMSTIAKGRIAGIDIAAARRVPGVLAVLTHQNTPKLPQKPKGADQNRPTDRLLQLLQDDVVRYANQPVAVVVAESARSCPRSRIAGGRPIHSAAPLGGPGAQPRCRLQAR